MASEAAESFVRSLYLTYFLREADPGGLAFYADALDLGTVTQAQLTQQFSEPENIVKDLYLSFFGREADPGGLAYYTNELTEGIITTQGILDSFADSIEGQFFKNFDTKNSGHSIANTQAAASLVDNGDGEGYVPQDCWPVDFLEIKVGSNPVTRLTNHFHDIKNPTDFDEPGLFNFVAVSNLLGFGDISSDLEAKDNSLSISLSGVGQATTSLVLANPIEGSRVYIRRGFYNSRTGKLVDAPYLRWAGRVHSYSISDDYRFSSEDTIVVSLSCRSLLVSLLSRQTGRYTNQAGFEQHLNSYTTPLMADYSMEFVSSLTMYAPDFGKGHRSSGDGGGKIVCTAMNSNYGFGSFRQSIWLDQSSELTPYHEKGYHTMFKPLVTRMYTEAWYNPWLTGWLEGVARRRTSDIWAVKRGREKRDMRARIERVIMEPICYLVGRFISK